MPFFEEKIISPLAIRFTQQRIREIFQDGREVEATIKEIKAMPGVGDYDVILHAPFPTIEIIRWSPNGRRSGGPAHWFSYDNRRLYCLQRKAAEYWPKRVGAIVEVLYADSGAIRKKLDSQTGGLSVNIGHAFAMAGELEQWAWHEAVQEHGPSKEAEAAIATDDAKVSVHDLMEAPAPERLSSSLEVNLSELIRSALVKSQAAAQTEAHGAASDKSTRAASQCSQSSDERLSSANEAEVPEEDGNHQQQVSSPAETSPTGEQSSESLIEELLDPVGPCTCSWMYIDSKGALQGPFQSNQMKTWYEHRFLHADLKLKRTSDADFATISEYFPQPKVPFLSQPANPASVAADSNGGALEVCAAATSKQKSPGKKVSMEAHDAKVAQQAQMQRAAQMQMRAARMQMAQRQCAQWQMTQWHAAQMAQWQHASFVQAAQAAQWQEAEAWA